MSQDPWPNVLDKECPECGSTDLLFYGVEPQYGECQEDECGGSLRLDYEVAEQAGRIAREAGV